MNYELLSKMAADAGACLPLLQIHAKSLQTTVAQLEPYLNKHLTEGAKSQDTEFRVCTLGPSCCKRGGIELLADMKEMAKDTPKAKVVESGCLRRCGRGPNVEVGGIVYTGMNKERAKTLMDTQLNGKTLSVDLLIDDEFAPEALKLEERRCQLDQTIVHAAELVAGLAAQIDALSNKLPADRNSKVLSEILIMRSIKLHGDLSKELNAAELLLKQVVPLDNFVAKIFEREMSAWRSAH